MMNINILHKYLQTIFNNCDSSLDKANKLLNNLARYTINDKIRIDKFAFDNELSQEQAETILNTLCDMQIMKKTERMYRCPKCGVLLGILSVWDEGDDIYCYACNTTHPRADICDTETIYSLYIVPTLKVFKVEWLDEFEKDSNGNPLPRKADIVAFTQSDAESVIDEYYHYMPDSIKISNEIELENKMLLKEYN